MIETRANQMIYFQSHKGEVGGGEPFVPPTQESSSAAGYPSDYYTSGRAVYHAAKDVANNLKYAPHGTQVHGVDAHQLGVSLGNAADRFHLENIRTQNLKK